MTPKELDNLLREWGYVYGEQPPREWDEDCTLTGPHPLEIARQFARTKGDRMFSPAWEVGRGASQYRWAANGGKGRVPGWAAATVPGKETRTAGAKALAGGRRYTPELARVEAAAIDLYRLDRRRGTILRLAYCRRGSHKDKAEMAASALGEPIKLRLFRMELELARTFMLGRLARLAA